jgi:hypothetical protein
MTLWLGMSEDVVEPAEVQPFALTAKWLRRVYPWRGFQSPPMRLKIDPMSAPEYAAVVEPRMGQRLLDPDSDPALIDRVASADWDGPDAVALGALASTSLGHREPSAERLITIDHPPPLSPYRYQYVAVTNHLGAQTYWYSVGRADHRPEAFVSTVGQAADGHWHG